jgi:hypothetical protein
MRSFLPSRALVMRKNFPYRTPKLPPEVRLENYVIRLNASQRAKMQRIGAAKFRRWLDAI